MNVLLNGDPFTTIIGLIAQSTATANSIIISGLSPSFDMNMSESNEPQEDEMIINICRNMNINYVFILSSPMIKNWYNHRRTNWCPLGSFVRLHERSLPSWFRWIDWPVGRRLPLIHVASCFLPASSHFHPDSITFPHFVSCLYIPIRWVSECVCVYSGENEICIKLQLL